MIEITLVTKSAGDENAKKASINTRELVKLGILKKLPKDGQRVTLKLAPIGAAPGILADQDFVASREGATLYSKDGFNHYLFGVPTRGNPIKVYCAGIVQEEKKLKAITVKVVGTHEGRTTFTTPSKSDLNRLLSKTGGNKAECARILGVSPRTFGRFLERRGLA
jgi:hypothetical protein